MELSLNEIETTVTKAAIGCGIDVGRAAAIGSAARWLCAREVDGVTEAAVVLGDWDREGDSDRLGLAAIDAAVATDRPVTIAGWASKPLLRALAADAGCEVGERSNGDEVELTVVPVDAAELPQPITTTMPAPPAWDQILRWAALTYVPSSEQSRTAGAGAGLTDND